jgi:hypothetical protein
VLDDLAQNTTIATADDEDLLGVGVRVHSQVGDHLLVRELVPLSALDDIVEDEHVAVVGRLEDQDVLVLALLMMQHLLDPEGHGLACQEFSMTGMYELQQVRCDLFTHRATSRRSRGTIHL